jgi:uncharacterized membrane protein YgaE (UPF0421/DUF939 family)
MKPLLKLPALQLSLRAACAAGLSFWIATLLGADYAIYALVASVLVTDLSPATSRRLALRRLAGTVVGATAGASLSYLLPIGPIAIAAAILAAMLVAYVARLEDAAARVAGYVAGIVIFAHGAHPWLYAFDRAWETVIGIITALAVGSVPLWVNKRGV